MGFQKGHRKIGGRKKGTPNKDTIPLEQKAQELDVDPFEILLYFAKGDWKSLGYKSATKTMYTNTGEPYEVEIITPEHRIKAAAESAQYLYPKRKAMEAQLIKNAEQSVNINLSWADNDDIQLNHETQDAPPKKDK